MSWAEIIPWLLVTTHVLIVLLAAIFISANRNPSSAIAWVMAIIFIPYLGIAYFLLVGSGKLPRRRREKQREVSERIMARTEGLHLLSRREEWPDWLPSQVRMNQHLGALPMVGGNRSILLPDYVGSIEAMAADIDRAKTYVHVEFFILVYDDTTKPFFDALARACARGVTVRVLSDHIAQFSYPNRKLTVQKLREMGARYEAMLPLRPFKGDWQRPDLRNHRKLVVIDGVVGHTGSQNLIDSSYNKKKNIKRGLHWHELMMRFEGPAVRELDAVFLSDWYSETDEFPEYNTAPIVLPEDPAAIDMQVLPSGPTFDNDNNAKLFTALIHSAQRRVSVTSPYFVPDEPIMMAMVIAASRGLDVELFVSEISDQFLVFHAQRSYYEALLRAGVKIYLYPAPTVLHAKHFSFDEDVAVIGSSNMDVRSLTLHMELSVLACGREFVDAMRAVEDDYRARSRLLTLEEWLRRPRLEKVFDNMARLTSSLM